MEKYVCAVCKNNIEQFSSGNFVKIKDSNGKILKVVPVHKGDCDDKLCDWGRLNGLNTNASMEISFFDTDEQRTEYLNGTFTMTDNELYQKFFNEYGTIKA